MTINFRTLDVGTLISALTSTLISALKKSNKTRWMLAAAMGSALLSPQSSFAQSRPPRPSPPPSGLVSGATRDECLVTNAAVAADDNHISHLFPTDSAYSYASYTADSTPRLWAHLPYAIDENSPIEFVLKQAETREVIYSSGAIAIEHSAGVIGFEVPIELQENVGYHWLVRVYCGDAAAHNPSQFIKGGIMYIAEDYDISERWYDQLSEVATAYETNPNDATTQSAWANVLIQTGLSTMPETAIQGVIELQP